MIVRKTVIYPTASSNALNQNKNLAEQHALVLEAVLIGLVNRQIAQAMRPGAMLN